MTDFEVNIKTLIDNKLGYEAYLILYSLYRGDKALVMAYVDNCKKINTEVFKQLQETNYLTIRDTFSGTEKIHFEYLTLTDKGKQLFRDNEDINIKFSEFRKHYPSRVKDGIRSRPLQGNLSKCKKLYEKLLLETTHEILCKAADLYTDEKMKSGDQMFMQALEAWLFQKNYQIYLEDIDKPIIQNNFTDDI